MAVQVSCREIGIEGCDFETMGDEPQVLEEIVSHVRKAHGFNLPEDLRERSVTELPDPERMIWSRIQNPTTSPNQAA